MCIRDSHLVDLRSDELLIDSVSDHPIAISERDVAAQAVSYTHLDVYKRQARDHT